MLRLKLIFGVAVFAAALAFSTPSLAYQDGKQQRVDERGDPLPDQALFRIGTTRLQHRGEVRAIAVSDDGRLLASCGSEKVVCVWDAKDGKQIRRFDLLSWGPWALAFAPNGKELVAVSRSPEKTHENGVVRRWDLTTGREQPAHRVVADTSLHFTYHVALAWQDDRSMLVAETAEQDISLYSPGKPRSGKTLKGHTGRVMSLCFTRDAKTLISLGDEGLIRFWNINSGKEFAKLPAPAMKDPGLKGNLATIAISADGKDLAVSLPDGSTRLLDAAGRELRRLPSSAQMHALHFSPDGKVLFTGRSMIESWNVENAEPRAILRQPSVPLRALSLSPDGAIAAFSDEHDRLRLVQIATGKMLCDRLIACRGGIAFAPDGKRLAIAPGDSTIGFWDVMQLHPSAKKERSDPAATLRCEGKVNAFTFSPDGKRLATVEDGKLARVYTIGSKASPLTLKPNGRSVYAVAFSADGKVIATTGEQTTFRHGNEAISVPQSVGLWSATTGKELPISADLRQLAHSVAFHPDGKSLAAIHLPVIARNAPHSGFRDIGSQVIPVEDRMETIRLWEVSSTREKFRFDDPIQRKNAEGANGWILGRSQAIACAFSPDGWIYAAADHASIVLSETASGQPRLRLGGHLRSITALAFTPDGNTLVSASSDSTLLIWDVTGLRTTKKLPGNSVVLWALLADSDAEKAGRAVFAMVDAPAESLAFLRTKLQPVAIRQEHVRKLVADLDHPSFAARDRAGRELATMGAVAEPMLVKHLQTKPSLEVSRRIQELLKGIQSGKPSLDQLRAIRAVEVLERIGTQPACEFLRELSQGTEWAYLTVYAREARMRSNARVVNEPGKQ